MRTNLFSHRTLTGLLCLSLIFGLCGPIDFTPSAEAATSAQKRKTRKLKKDNRKLKKQNQSLRMQLAAALAASGTPVPAPSFIEMVPVPAGVLAENPADTLNSGSVPGIGIVPYDFQIGKYEVTLDEYAAFLNAVAKFDAGGPNPTGPNGLYDSSMGTLDNTKGIARTGSNGNYVYTVIGSGKRPVTFVSWFDAARFCNWLHNGRPSGLQVASTTERGAYTLDGATIGVGFTRNPGAKYWIPSEHEWYKAAYHHPNSQGGPADHYYLYPTMSDITVPGNIVGAAPNQANFETTVFSVTQAAYVVTENYLTDGGSYPGSPSFYGTFDQGGNVREWNDAVIGSFRGLRGGSWSDPELHLSSSLRNSNNPGREGPFDGFRIASP